MTKVLISYIIVTISYTYNYRENLDVMNKAKEGYELHGSISCDRVHCYQPMVKYEYRE